METELTLTSSQPKPLPKDRYARSRSAVAMMLRIAALLVFPLTLSALVNADEPMEKFVGALRDRGYFDIAIEYLDRVKPSVLSVAARQQLPFERAQTYREAAANSRDLRQVDTMLAAAQKAIGAYQPTNATNATASATARFRGDLLFSRARINMARASRKQLSETQRGELVKQTREYLAASQNEYQTATKQMAAALKVFQIDPEDSSTATELTRLRSQYTFLKTRGPTLNERLADTWNSGSVERTELLKTTAAEAKAVWTKYRKYKPALQACLTAASCYQKLEELDSSQQMISEIFALQRSDVSPTVRREALSIAVGNWQAMEPFPWQTVIAETEPAINVLTPQQANQPQWLPIRLAFAQALHEKANSLSGQKGAAPKRQAREASEAAIKLAQAVAQVPGDLRQTAVSLLKSWDADSAVPPPPTAANTSGEAKSFAQAESQGKAIVREIDSLLREISAATRNVRQAGSAAEKQQAQTARNNLKQKLNARADAALNLFNQAVLLADDSVTRPQLNGVRYLQCYSYFAKQQYIESSVIAEFLLDKVSQRRGNS